MDTSLAIVVIVLALAIVFLLIAARFQRVQGEIRSPFVTGHFTGHQIPHATSKVKIRGLSGRNVRIKSVVGTESAGCNGEVCIEDIEAKEDVDLGNISGVQGDKRKE